MKPGEEWRGGGKGLGKVEPEEGAGLVQGELETHRGQLQTAK